MPTQTLVLDPVQAMLVQVVAEQKQAVIAQAGERANAQIAPLYAALGIPDGTVVRIENGIASWETPDIPAAFPPSTQPADPSSGGTP